MLEINDLIFEGLPENQQKLAENEEEKEKEKEKGKEKDEEEEDDIFIHEDDELQKSMMESYKKRQTFALPKSRIKIEDKSNLTMIKGKKKEKSEIEKEYEVTNVDDLDFINKEQESISYSKRGGYLDIDQILQLEDPFMRASRPSGFNYNYKRISALDQRVKTTKPKKRKKDYFFKEKPKTYNISEKKSQKTLKQNDNTTEKSDDITEKSNETDKSDNDNIEKKKKNEEDEDEDEDEDLHFIENSRPSFLSRESIELDDTTFEVEVIDSVAMTVLQIINCMIKANLVQIAISMKELGLIWGPITICIIALMSLISLNLILEVNKMTGQRSYLIFSEMIFGHFGSVIILICQFMSAFGGCLSFIVIFNKVVPSLLSFSLPNKEIADDKIFSIILGTILFFFCYKQDVNIIKSAAKYAVFAVLLFFFLTILDFIIAVLSQNRLISLNSLWNKEKRNDILFGLNQSKYNSDRISNIVTAVACIILSYSFHIFTFSIYGCMGKISRKQFFITTSVSVLITTIIYLICGTIGYLLYYDYLTDSILDAIQETWLSSLLSLANVINVIMTFPITFSAVKNYFILFIGIMITLIRDFFLLAFSCIPNVNSYKGRISTENISKVFRKDNNKIFLMSGKPLVQIPKFIEMILTILIYFLVFLFASMYTKLKVIFSFTGGVMGNILSFIFPSIFYLGFAKKKAFSKYGFVAIFFIIFGFGTMGICIASTIKSIKN